MIQLQVLNKVVRTKDISLITRNNLNVDFFSDLKLEFNFIMNHYNQYGTTPDYETLLSRFPDFKVINVEEGDSYLLNELIRDKNTRDMANAFNTVRNLIMQNKSDEALQVFKQSSEKLSVSRGLEAVNITKDTSRYDRYIDKTQNFSKYYVKTGLPELDKIILGWDRQEELATIIAKSGIGKTWLMLFFATKAAEQGLHVGIYSGEMSVDKVALRIDTLAGHISNGSLMHGNENIKLDYKNYIDNIKDTLKGDIEVLTPFNISGPANVSALRAFIEKYNLDILFIDQHSLLEDERGAKGTFEKAANISYDLRILQTLKKIPFVCVSQMNRTKNDDDPELISLDQIQNSSRIGQDSTIVLGISRDKNDKNIIKVQIVKSRDTGEVGRVLTYYTDLNLGTFKYIPEEGESLDNTDYEHRYDVNQSQTEQPNGGEVFNWS